MITLLMLSNGTPMFRAGDEFLQTQTKTAGPGTWDNPYNVDDPSVWMNWTRLERFKDIFGFFSKMIAFRKRHPSISRSRFWGSDVQWYGPQGNPDFSSSSHTLAIYLHGQNPQFGIEDKDLYVMINAYWEAITFSFQQPGPWNRVVNTGLDAGSDFIAEYQELVTETSYLVGPRSVIVFVM